MGHALEATLFTEGHDVAWFENANDALQDAIERPPRSSCSTSASPIATAWTSVASSGRSHHKVES